MIEARKKSITVYAVDGKGTEYRTVGEATEAALTVALGGARSSITIVDLVSSMLEPAVRHAIQSIINSLDDLRSTN